MASQTNSQVKAKPNAVDSLYVTGFKQTIIVVLVLLAILVLVIVILYIISRVKSSTLQQVVLQTEVVQLDNAKEVPLIIKSDKMSMVTAGHEFSYSFWIYLGSNYSSTSGHKLIIERGPVQDTASNVVDVSTNPIIFMDKNTNKMYVALATNKVAGNNITLDDVLARDANGKYNSGFIVSYIDYVPLQRWVNICVAVRDNTGYLFMDGDLYSVVTVNDLVDSRNPIRPIIKGTTGDLRIGNRINNTSGFISYSSFFNYALTQGEISSMYRKGPYPKTILSYLGLGNYGVRSPVFRLDA